jgi:hypothetical protein
MAVLEVKGTFWEYIVYLAHSVGRNSTEDVVVFRPDGRLALAKFEDEYGRFWYLNAMPHTWRAGETSSEAHQLFSPLKRPNGGVYPPTFFKDGPLNREMQEELRTREVPVPPDLRFVGWRWDGEDHLVRVSHTKVRDTPVPWEPEGKRIRVAAPTKLRFVEVFHLSNGLRTNLIKPNLPVAEVASRLKILAKLAKGGGGGEKGNDFFYDAAEKQIQNCIQLHRYVHRRDGVQCTAIDLVRLTTSDQALDSHLKTVEQVAQEIKAEIELESDLETRQMRLDREFQPMIDLLAYFKNEWRKLQQGEGKVAHSVNGVITNAFSKFLTDPNLRETYCSAQTVDYESIFNEGKLLCFVPGPEYEMSQRQLAVDFKMDVVSTGLQRKALGLDMFRPVCFAQDEGHEYIISHEVVGDTKALAQLREFRMFYLLGTQSDSWVDATIGANPSKVYRQGFGTCVWLRQNDEATNRVASMLCGKIKVEDRKIDQKVSLPEVLIGGDMTATQQVGIKEKNFVEPEEFSFLKTGKGVVWRTGEQGQDEQVKRVDFPFHYTTSEEGHAAVGDRLRHYMREIAENTLHGRGETGRINQVKVAAQQVAPSPETPAAGAEGTLGTPATVPTPPPAAAASGSGGAAEPTPPVSNAGDSTPPGSGALSPVPPIDRDSTPITFKFVPTPPAPTSAPERPVAPETAPLARPAGPVPAFTNLGGVIPQGNTARPSGPPSPATGGRSRKDIEQRVLSVGIEMKLKTLMSQVDSEPVASYKAFVAEESAHIGNVARKEHLLDTRLATGSKGAVLGSKPTAATAAPMGSSRSVTFDLKDIAEAETEKNETKAAIERAANEVSEPTPDREELAGIDHGVFARLLDAVSAEPQSGDLTQ